MKIRDAILSVIKGEDLPRMKAMAVMQEIMTGVATPPQIAAFLTALHIKGETHVEIAAMADVMRQHALQVEFDGTTIDTCGTGGDHSKTFNISTTVAFVVAGAGPTVAKHGNRGISSASGSADVLEALGVKIELEPEGVACCLREAGIGFMFAPVFHPAMRFAGPVRREIGIRTVFNFLGPLTNPAGAQHQVIGVPSVPIALKIANALNILDTTHSIVVYGDGGMDELSLNGLNILYNVRRGHELMRILLDPMDLGFARAPNDALRGGTAVENAVMIRNILDGKEQGPKRDVVLFNAALALYASDTAPDLFSALDYARNSLDSGRALARLEKLIEVSNRV